MPQLRDVGRDLWSRQAPSEGAATPETGAALRRGGQTPVNGSPQALRRSTLNGNSQLRLTSPTFTLPGVCPMAKKRAKRRLSAS